MEPHTVIPVVRAVSLYTEKAGLRPYHRSFTHVDDCNHYSEKSEFVSEGDPVPVSFSPIHSCAAFLQTEATVTGCP